jgi:ribose transport system permease protein
MSAVSPPLGGEAVSLPGPRRVGLFAAQYGVVIATLLLFLVLSITSDAFLTTDNLRNLLEQNAPIGIAAVATTPLLIARGIDLSIGGLYGLAGIFAAMVTNSSDPLVGILVGVFAGLVLGTANGLVCTVFKVNALIATLASGIIMGGVALVVTHGFAISVSDPGFRDLGMDKFLGIGIAAWLFIGLAVVGQLLLSKATFGRRVFSSGGNPEAARLAGIRVSRVLVLTFALSGLGAALAGIIVTSRVAQASPELGGNSVLFAALTAVLVGGTSIQGGEGAIWRSVVGVFLLAFINNGFNLLGIDPLYTSIVQGTVILLAMVIDAQGRRLVSG